MVGREECHLRTLESTDKQRSTLRRFIVVTSSLLLMLSDDRMRSTQSSTETFTNQSIHKYHGLSKQVCDGSARKWRAPVLMM